MIVERVFDAEQIKKIIYHPEVINYSTDGTIKDDIETTGICWIGTFFGGKMVGVFVFEPLNRVALDVHCYFLPKYRKLVSSEAFLKSVGYIFSQSQYSKLIVKCTKKDWHVKNFCLSRGFNIEGLTKESALHKNKLVDEYILGLTKKEFERVTNV